MIEIFFVFIDSNYDPGLAYVHLAIITAIIVKLTKYLKYTYIHCLYSIIYVIETFGFVIESRAVNMVSNFRV